MLPLSPALAIGSEIEGWRLTESVGRVHVCGTEPAMPLYGLWSGPAGMRITVGGGRPDGVCPDPDAGGAPLARLNAFLRSCGHRDLTGAADFDQATFSAADGGLGSDIFRTNFTAPVDSAIHTSFIRAAAQTVAELDRSRSADWVFNQDLSGAEIKEESPMRDWISERDLARALDTISTRHLLTSIDPDPAEAMRKLDAGRPGPDGSVPEARTAPLANPPGLVGRLLSVLRPKSGPSTRDRPPVP